MVKMVQRKTKGAPVQDPRARVVGSEPDSNIIASYTHCDDVALDGVHVVIGITACTPDDVEDVAVKVERVLHEGFRSGIRHGSHELDEGMKTYRTTSGTGRNRNLDGLVPLNGVDTAGWKELLD